MVNGEPTSVALETALKLGMAVGLPVVIEYWLGELLVFV